MIYRQRRFEIVEYTEGGTVTLVSDVSLFICVLMFVFVVVVRLVFVFTIDGDIRPALNCIDGLSSILRVCKVGSIAPGQISRRG